MGTRKMEILLAIVFILVGSVGVNSSTKLEGIYPIQFTERTSEAYVYTNTISRTFMESFNVTEGNIRQLIDEAFTTPVRCKQMDDKRCEEIKLSMPGFHNAVRDLAQRELNSVFFELRHDIDRHIRRKRAVDSVIGILLHSFCDVALMDDITELIHKDNNRRHQISGILKTMNHMREDMKNLTVNFNDKLENIKNELAVFADQLEIRSLMRNQIKHLIFYFDKIHDSCNRRVVPSNVFDLDTLSEHLENIESELKPLDLTLAIPLTSIHDYYKLRICSCQFMDEGINMTVHIPVKPKNATYKLYSPIYLPFKFDDQICSIQAQDAVLINDTKSGRIQVSSAQYLKNCDLGTHLCKLHSIYNSNIDSWCLQETFLKKNVTELQPLCPFVCTPKIVDRPLINHLGGDEYVITNMPNNIYVENYQSRNRLHNTNKNAAAYRLKLPCSSRLVQDFVTVNNSKPDSYILIDYVLPCNLSERNLIEKTYKLKPVIPLQWLANATRLTTTLNADWKNFTPIYSIMTDSEWNARLSKIAELNTPIKLPPSDTIITFLLAKFLPEEVVDNIYLLCSYICNLIVASLLYHSVRTMRRRLQRVEIGLISRGGGGATLLPLHRQQDETTLPRHLQHSDSAF